MAQKPNRSTRRASGERGPAPVPEPHPDYRPQPDGTLLWRLGETEYRLRPLTAGAMLELDTARQFGGFEVIDQLRRATDLPSLPQPDLDRLEAIRAGEALPETTDEERAAKIATLEAARAMPEGTTEDRSAVQEAKLNAVRDGQAANLEWILGWYELLFREAEAESRPFPRELAPAWLYRASAMQTVLGDLEGPRPPGVA